MYLMATILDSASVGAMSLDPEPPYSTAFILFPQARENLKK